MVRPPKAGRWLLTLPVLLAACTVGWTFECAKDLQELLALAGTGVG